MKLRSRCFLAAAGALVLCLSADYSQLAPAHQNDLTVSPLSEADGASHGPRNALLTTITPQASWEGLFAAVRW